MSGKRRVSWRDYGCQVGRPGGGQLLTAMEDTGMTTEPESLSVRQPGPWLV